MSNFHGYWGSSRAGIKVPSVKESQEQDKPKTSKKEKVEKETIGKPEIKE